MLACIVPIAGCVLSEADDAESKEALTVASGREVSLEYTLRPDNGDIYSTNVGSDPLTYTHGRNQLIRGLESALEGMTIGERKLVTVAPIDGYGETNPLHMSEVPKEFIPPDLREVGAELQTPSRHGQRLTMTVVEVKDETIVMDFNHPLAGKTLHFDVEVVDIH